MAASLTERQLGLRNGADDGRLDPVDTVEEACNSRWRSPRRDRYPAPRSLIDSNVMHAASTKKLTAPTGQRILVVTGDDPAAEPLHDNRRRHHLDPRVEPEADKCDRPGGNACKTATK